MTAAETILRGQLVTSVIKLSEQTGLSVGQVRVSLKHLKMTGEITSKAYSKYHVITIVKYDDYQGNDKQDDKQMTNEQQTNSKQITNEQQTNNKRMTNEQQTNNKQMTTSIENIESIERVERVEGIESVATAQRFTPPTRAEIEGFIRENGLEIDADRFLYYYQSNGWMVGRNPMRDWKAVIRSWAAKDRKEKAEPTKTVLAQQYGQRDYSGVPAEIMERQNRKMEEFLRQKREAEAKEKCAAG